MIRLEDFRDRADAVEAVGLRELAASLHLASAILAGMSQENVEVARQALEAVLRRPDPDLTTGFALFDREHEFVSYLDAVDGGSHFGGAGYRAWLAETAEVADWEASVEEVRVIDEDRVLVIMPTKARGIASGAQLGTTLGCVLTVQGGRIIRTAIYGSPEQALEAVGLRE